MKKTTKRILSALLAFTLLFGLAATCFAGSGFAIKAAAADVQLPDVQGLLEKLNIQDLLDQLKSLFEKIKPFLDKLIKALEPLIEQIKSLLGNIKL